MTDRPDPATLVDAPEFIRTAQPGQRFRAWMTDGTPHHLDGHVLTVVRGNFLPEDNHRCVVFAYPDGHPDVTRANGGQGRIWPHPHGQQFELLAEEDNCG